MRPFWTALAVAALSITAVAQERDRAKIPDKFKWDLGDIYRNEAAWRAAKDKLSADIQSLGSFKGKLTASPAALADALDRIYAVAQELGRAYSYASLRADETRASAPTRGCGKEMVQVAAAFSAATSYVDPEILKAGKATIDQFLAAEPRLKPYRMRLDDVVRRAAHTLSDSEEKLLADALPMAGSAATSSVSRQRRLPVSDGHAVGRQVGAARRGRLLRGARSAQSCRPREGDVHVLQGARRLQQHVRHHDERRSAEGALLREGRRYPTALESELDGPNIPVSVYSRLVEGVNRNLASFHRYLSLRKRMMGVSELHYYDLYAPLVSSVKLEYTPEDAQKIVLAAVAPLGADYQATIRRAFDDRWIDLLPNDGKRSGAYSNDVFGVHPFMLINYNGQYSDVSTLAHELGHTMQSYLSDKAQPFPTADYPIFVAEVASTFNEALLNDYLLKQIKDDDARLSILGGYLENIKGTVFRQTQFAEFELRLHQMAQNGQPITGDALAKLYLDITRRYYGTTRA
jgi:oligoendopeptidase F